MLASFSEGIPKSLPRGLAIPGVHLPAGQPQQKDHPFSSNSLRSPGIGSDWPHLVTCQSPSQICGRGNEHPHWSGLVSPSCTMGAESGEQVVPQSETKVQLPKARGREAGQTRTATIQSRLLGESSQAQNLTWQMSPGFERKK